MSNPDLELFKSFIVKTMRKIKRLDVFMPIWFFHIPEQKTMTDHVFLFMEHILFSKANFRIENGVIYYLEGDITGIFLRNFDQQERDLLLKFTLEWNKIFKKKYIYDINTDYPNYNDCFFNFVVEECFPRKEICLRFLATTLLKSMKGEQQNDSVEFVNAIHMRVWTSLYFVIVRLSNKYTNYNFTPFYTLLLKKQMYILKDWKFDNSVSP